ncbi:hypothetical protein SDC9_78676 [bioreactor metagenome]|uniref:Uncharacterized protein n=1 Tax=bioreactor metagenome TaxID=1076179 RepID=A0A644YUW1_9ZZZZ
MKRKRIDLGGCKLILRDGKAPRVKVPKSKQREIARMMDGGLVLADRGIRLAGRQMKRLAGEMPAFRRVLMKNGKKLARRIEKRMK